MSIVEIADGARKCNVDIVSLLRKHMTVEEVETC